MDLGLTGRVAAIAGGTSGLGRASADLLASEGAIVAVCGRSADGVADAAGAGLDAATVDVTDHATARAWIDGVAERHGGLHVVVANAGGPPAGPATAFDIDAYRDAVELSLLSMINLVQAALPHLRETGWGRVLFITSKSVRQPIPTLALSNTARMGLVGYAKSLVAELGDAGITINVLAPGSTHTERLEQLVVRGDESVDAAMRRAAASIPLGRVGQPEEFAAALAFLASERASFITGVTLPVDGGEIQGV